LVAAAASYSELVATLVQARIYGRGKELECAVGKPNVEGSNLVDAFFFGFSFFLYSASLFLFRGVFLPWSDQPGPGHRKIRKREEEKSGTAALPRIRLDARRRESAGQREGGAAGRDGLSRPTK
jgi:hypothetical protein